MWVGVWWWRPSCGRSPLWSAVAAATAFLVLAVARWRYEAKTESGSCCYRTPKRFAQAQTLTCLKWAGEAGLPAHQNPCVSAASRRRIGVNPRGELSRMVKFLLWCILLVLCWPLALLALVLYPVVWVLTLPFRLVGIAVGGVFDLLRALITLPARILRGPRHV